MRGKQSLYASYGYVNKVILDIAMIDSRLCDGYPQNSYALIGHDQAFQHQSPFVFLFPDLEVQVSPIHAIYATYYFFTSRGHKIPIQVINHYLGIV